MLFRRLERIESEYLVVVDGDGTTRFGNPTGASIISTVHVRDPRFYLSVVLGGSMGAAEAYLRGYWETDNLVGVVRIMSRNGTAMADLDRGISNWSAPFRRLGHFLARNTPAGSKRNIAAHYDLSNEFFATFLDSTMTYSCGLFQSSETSMADASLAKYERLCQRLELCEEDHVLEIGTGWGGFACYAAREYGCRVTTTTISPAQYQYAQRRIERQGLADRIQLLRKDYRELEGQYDKLVSIEMVEAVGHEFHGQYFRKCNELLRAGGLFALQAITIPDQRYDSYRHSVDFIQRHIFPGGCLPSLGALLNASSRNSNFMLSETVDFGKHYAATLWHWRNQFFHNIDAIRQLGKSDRFLRAWDYYFCYCEGAFREQMIGCAQMLFRKPQIG